jgi:hypothetical protein
VSWPRLALTHGKITARIEELQAAHAERHKLTVDGLLCELEEARQAAALPLEAARHRDNIASL